MALSRLLVVKTTRSMKYSENPIGYGFFCFSEETDYNTNKKTKFKSALSEMCGPLYSVQRRIEGRRGSEISYVLYP